ncbi:MFS transporter [Bacillus sp. EB106-08-02-XG196]|jgi:sugar phosphate permease|uniref:MFS transporter n=1 Tax=Bacillus sp. EB106-08-02-XG196 TaxID=2737049 RepID=UPI0015C483EE|nr:MFS transporter [Bacillus sp. EB106-08-02-XG196]NWQ41960.1 MFS transporter [Bacillus sp. EB106-08-02-XG196]
MKENIYNNKTKTTVLTLLFLTWVVNYLDKNSMSVAIIAISKEFSLTPTQGGMVISSFFLAYALMQLLGGWLTDKYGSKKVILISLLVWSIFTIFTGFAWSFVSLIIIRFLFGIGEGSFPSASSVALAENFPKEERGRAKGVLSASTQIGSIIAVLLAAVLIQSVGWNIMFYIFGALGFVFLLLLWKYLPDRAQQTGTAKKQKVSYLKVLKNPTAWLLMLIYFGMSMVNWGLNSWLPSYWVNVRGLELVKTGFISMLPVACSIIAIILSSWALDKIAAGKEKFIIITGAIIGMVALYFTMSAESISMALTFLCLAYFGVGLLSVVLALPLKYFPQNTMGSTIGIMYFGGQMAGTIAPTLIGYTLTLFNGSYNGAFTLLIGSLFISIIASLFLKLNSTENAAGREAA